MTPQQERLIKDNPNLSSSALAKLIGVHKNTVINFKKRAGIVSNWYHFGVGIPFVGYDKSVTAYRVRKDGVRIFFGSFKGAMLNLDRLIYCLDNNSGKLPPTFEESIFSDLIFIK